MCILYRIILHTASWARTELRRKESMDGQFLSVHCLLFYNLFFLSHCALSAALSRSDSICIANSTDALMCCCYDCYYCWFCIYSASLVAIFFFTSASATVASIPGNANGEFAECTNEKLDFHLFSILLRASWSAPCYFTTFTASLIPRIMLNGYLSTNRQHDVYQPMHRM